MNPSPVKQLLVELAEEDAHSLAVNAMLYQRSRVYQHALDLHLGGQGYRVCGERGSLRVTVSPPRRFHARAGYVRHARPLGGDRGGACCGQLALSSGRQL